MNNNNSYATESNFSFVLSRIEGVVYNLQSVSLPAITLSERLVQAKPADYSQPGEKLIFDKLNLSFIVDENADNHQSIQDWMWEMVNPNKGTLGKESKNISDAVLTILDKNKKPVKNYRFVGCFPIMCGELPLSTTGTQNRQLVCQMTLAYSHYYEEKSTVAAKELKPV